MTLGIETRNLTLRYGAVTAVDDLSFRLDGGKIYGLLGRNGSGKTSLLSVLSGYRKATDGEALIDGQPVFENPEVARRTCFIRESGDTVDHDWPADRVRDAIALAGALRPHWDGDYAHALLDRFGVSTRKRLGELSRGQRAAMATTLGLAARAPVTIFDESYLGMDAPSRQMFHDELLADFMAHPRTVVVSTHLIEEVSALLEEVIIIDRGRLLLHEEADALRSRGCSVTGPAEEVDRLTEGLTVLGQRRLGATKQAQVYGEFDGERRALARDAGLELGPLPLQDLFIHLTEPESAGAQR